MRSEIDSKLQDLQVAVLCGDRAELVRIAGELGEIGCSLTVSSAVSKPTAADIERLYNALLMRWLEAARDAEACPIEQRGEMRLHANRLRLAVDAVKAKRRPSGELLVWAEDRAVNRAQALLMAREALGRSWQAALYALIELAAASRMTSAILKMRFTALLWRLIGR